MDVICTCPHAHVRLHVRAHTRLLLLREWRWRRPKVIIAIATTYFRCPPRPPAIVLQSRPVAVWDWECQRQEKRPLRWRCCRVGRKGEREVEKKRERQLENICCNTNLPQLDPGPARPTRHSVSEGATTDIAKSRGKHV